MCRVKLVVAALVVLGACGEAGAQAQAPSIGPSQKRYTTTPYMTQVVQTFRTDKDGKTITTRMRNVRAEDSRGRHLFRWTNLDSGISSTTVEDPVKAEHRVWSPEVPVVKVLRYPRTTAQLSCWKSDDDPGASPKEPRMGSFEFTCPARDGGAFGFCWEPGLAAERASPRTVQPPPGEAECEQFLGSNAGDAKPEDLGETQIAGWPAHGCRVARPSLDGDGAGQREAWVSAIPPENSVRFLARGMSEFRMGVATVRQTTELEILQPGEPDETVFEPPSGYETKVLAVHEVACKTVTGSGTATTTKSP